MKLCYRTIFNNIIFYLYNTTIYSNINDNNVQIYTNPMIFVRKRDEDSHCVFD